MTAVISMKNLTKIYRAGNQEVIAIYDITISIMKKEYVAIVGSSGSGKSTFMNILGCLDNPTSGKYYLRGHDVAEMSDAALSSIRNTDIGFVFQNFNLMPRMSALENVVHPLLYRKMNDAMRTRLASAALEKVGLSTRSSHRPAELSGGQRQRVAIARALVTSPSIILADEPTGNLDSVTTGDILRLFDELNEEGHTIILVTHDMDVARRCRRIITLADGHVAGDSLNEPCPS